MKAKKNTAQMIEYTKLIILDEMSRCSGGVSINITVLNGEYEKLKKYFTMSMKELMHKDKYFYCTSYDEMDNIPHYSGHLTPLGKEFLESQQFSNKLKNSYLFNLFIQLILIIFGSSISIFIAKIFKLG